MTMKTMRIRTLAAAVMVGGLAAPALAQAPVEPAGASAPVAPAMSAVPAAIPVGSRVGEWFTTYEDGGRRDPFATLVAPRRTMSGPVDGRPRRGLASLSLADVAVKGIVKNGDTMLAIIEGPNRQSFVARASDELFDATIASIDTSGVVFAQQIDASMPPNHVRKSLRAAGEEVR
jgi:hypothetical protein